MNDVLKLCATCKHEHPYGIIRMSVDNVPLYGPHRCIECRCDNFVEYDPIIGNALALTQEQTNLLWDKTSFLNPQVPAATRIAVAQLETLEGAEREKAFMSLMISQLTDVRGAMVREDSKFAHLIAHTDEVVEAMKGVVQLSERLAGIAQRLEGMEEALSKKEEIGPVRRFFMRAFAKIHLRDEAIVTDADPATGK